MLSVASEVNKYQLIIPEMAYYFEQMIMAWYMDEACHYEWAPQPSDMLGEGISPYTQAIIDIFAESRAIEDGEAVDGIVPDGVWEAMMHAMGDNYEWWYPRMLEDIHIFLDSHQFFYNAFEYTGDEWEGVDFRNVPLQEVW